MSIYLLKNKTICREIYVETATADRWSAAAAAEEYEADEEEEVEDTQHTRCNDSRETQLMRQIAVLGFVTIFY